MPQCGRCKGDNMSGSVRLSIRPSVHPFAYLRSNFRNHHDTCTQNERLPKRRQKRCQSDNFMVVTKKVVKVVSIYNQNVVIIFDNLLMTLTTFGWRPCSLELPKQAPSNPNPKVVKLTTLWLLIDKLMFCVWNTVQDLCQCVHVVSNKETFAIKSCAQRSGAFDFLKEGAFHSRPVGCVCCGPITAGLVLQLISN